MNAFGLHALVLISDWDAAGAEKAIRTAAAIGYDIIEAPLFDPAVGRSRAHARPVAAARIDSIGKLGVDRRDRYFQCRPAISRAGVARLHKVVDATAFIGGTVVAGVIGSAWQKYLAPATDAGYKNAVSGLREVAQEARAKGVVLAIEVVNRFESNLLNTAAQGLRLVEAIGEDNVGVHLDTFHMHIEEADAAAAIRACGSALRYFHVNENHRGYLGAGSIDFAPIFRALVSAGYAGAITFEAFSSSTCTPAIAGNAAVWRSVFEDGEDVASRALGFLEVGDG